VVERLEQGGDLVELCLAREAGLADGLEGVERADPIDLGGIHWELEGGLRSQSWSDCEMKRMVQGNALTCT
jgi:hypothetical protein